MINVYLSPSESVDGIISVIKVNGEKVQVNNKLYDFTNLADGMLRVSTGDISYAKRVDGVLWIKIDNYIVSSTATQDELFPQWQTIDRNDVLNDDVEIVPIDWITQEELEAIENAPKPLSEADQIRLEMARSNAEMFEMMVSMMGGAM